MKLDTAQVAGIITIGAIIVLAIVRAGFSGIRVSAAVG